MAADRQNATQTHSTGPGVSFQIEPETSFRCAVLQPWSKSHGTARTQGSQLQSTKGHGPGRTSHAALEEALGLADAINLEIVYQDIISLQKPRPATLFGKGKVEELKAYLRSNDAGLVIVNTSLTPVQQRNLETAWNVKILDRTGLILEIFGKRAQTREGRLQVELAHLNYQKGRLVRSWTHLERQRGALGFVGGPGETQIEADRRYIRERIAKLTKQLDKVRQTRTLHRSSRKKVPYPIIALVGYTNAGKSTLFNAITKADVKAQDLLFATLDPTMRAVDLPNGMKVILSDTVGFISDLPTDLIAAFRATLEEVHEADLIVHVRDIAHDDTEAQAGDVALVLNALTVDAGLLESQIEVWNKIDLLDEQDREAITTRAERNETVVAISSLTGEGVDRLIALFEHRLATRSETFDIVLDAGQGADIHWLHENCDVIERVANEDGTLAMKIAVPAVRAGQFEQRFTKALGR